VEDSAGDVDTKLLVEELSTSEDTSAELDSAAVDEANV
jgi:hypothetical protein